MRWWLGVLASCGVVCAVVDCGDADGGGLPAAPKGTSAASSSGGSSSGDPDLVGSGSDAGDVPEEGDATTSVNGEMQCDRTKPFGDAELVFDSTVRSATPRLSADERTIYFTGGGGTNGTELFRAVRSSRTAKFGAPVAMTAQSSTANDNDPSASADHLRLFFHSARSGNNEIYFSTRKTTSDDFGPPALVPGVNDATVADAHAYYRANGGGELWLTSRRGSTTYRIFRAAETATGFGKPKVVADVTGAADAWNDAQPMITEDGLTLLLASTRPNGKGAHDLWIAERASDDAPWGAPKTIDELNSANQDYAGWISADRCRLWFSSNREVGGDTSIQRTYFASRPL